MPTLSCIAGRIAPAMKDQSKYFAPLRVRVLCVGIAQTTSSNYAIFGLAARPAVASLMARFICSA